MTLDPNRYRITELDRLLMRDIGHRVRTPPSPGLVLMTAVAAALALRACVYAWF